MALLQIENLEKAYGPLQVLRDINLCINPGAITAIIGPNGAGKTTLFRVLAGMTYQNHGSLFFEGEKVHSLGNNPHVSFLFDDHVLFQHESAAMNYRLIAALNSQRISSTNAQKWADTVVPGVGKRQVRRMSHGMQRRLSLALVVAFSNPSLLILDEPTNGLDARAVMDLEKYLVERARSGTAILLSTHYLEMVPRICQKVIIVRGGKVFGELDNRDIEIGKLREIFL